MRPALRNSVRCRHNWIQTTRPSTKHSFLPKASFLQATNRLYASASMVPNKAFVYKSVPDGWPKPGKDVVVESTDFDPNGAPPPGGFTTKNLYATFDPAQRSSMRDPNVKSYNKAMELDKPILAITVIGQVLKSDAENFKEGDHVLMFNSPTVEYSTVTKDQLAAAKPLYPTEGIPLTAYVGALGLTGITAFGSLHEIGKPKKGETIVVSAAAGAIGQMVGQVAVREGLKVIGSVGDDRKAEFITKELGFTAAFNYKTEKPADALDRLCPDGIDIYYDNVGGELLDMALARMNNFGRIVACGSVSTYNVKPGEEYGIKNYVWINRKRLRYQGFILTDPDIMQHTKKRDEDITKWILDGSFKSVEHVIEGGMEAAPEGFIGMFKGQNLGRTVLKI